MAPQTVEVHEIPCTIRTLIQDPNLILTEYGQKQVRSDLVFIFEKSVWIQLILYGNHPENDQIQYGFTNEVRITDWGNGTVHILINWNKDQEKDIFMHPDKYVGALIQVITE